MSTASNHFVARQVDNVHVIEFERAHITDAAYIKVLGDEIYRYLKPLQPPLLVVDFKKVEYLSSSTLSMLVALKKVVAKAEGQLRITGLSKDLFEVFRITKFDKVFKICATASDGIEDIEQS